MKNYQTADYYSPITVFGATVSLVEPPFMLSARPSRHLHRTAFGAAQVSIPEGGEIPRGADLSPLTQMTSFVVPLHLIFSMELV